MQQIHAAKIAEGLVFGEGIRWRHDHLVLSDMLGKRVLRVAPDTGEISTLLTVENQPNGLVVQADGSLLIASMFDAKILHLKNEAVSVYVNLADYVTGYLGDMVSDAQGNLYVDDVGARVLHGEKPGPGRLILVRPDRSIAVVREKIAFPNGLVLSGDGRRLYLAETMTSTIHSFPRLDNGLLGAPAKFADLSSISRIDGMTMDEEDGIWACMLDKEFVIRIAANGEPSHQVMLAGVEPIATTIGGADGQTLFVTGIDAIKGKNIFEEMMQGRVRSSIWAARIPFSKGLSRP